MQKLLFIFVSLFCCCVSLYAQQESYSDELTGTLHINDLVTITEAKYGQLLSDPNWTSEFADLHTDNYIRLQYDPQIPIIATGTQSTSVNISVDWWDASGILTTFTTTLSLDYDDNGTQLVNDRSTYYFTGAHKMKITVTSITGPNVGNLILNGDIRIDRRYLFAGTAIASSDVGVNVVGTNNDYYEFYWPSQEGANKYELEWVYVNDYTTTASSYISSNLLYYDFYLNSTRIEVMGNSYRIPRIFDHGYLLFRVRGVGKWEPAFEYRKDGQWSTTESGDVASFISAHPTQAILITDEYEYLSRTTPYSNGSKNWQHSVKYTEEGKRFESVAFTDGLGRVRQRVAHNTETAQAVVSNIYYDFHGRPAVQDLGTPVDGEELKLYPYFNLAENTTDVYGPAYFDVMSSAVCPPIASGFEQTTGAGKYYSVNNPDQTEENQYIPDANGFPFARTLYMPDETGRLRRQGAYGEDFQVGLGHETKFYYAIPTQAELNRLFGTDVGWNTHYQKKITFDPNGQIYTEYEDMAGRVIASGLAGDAPATLDQLADNYSVTLPVIMFHGPLTQIVTDGITAQYEVDQFFDSNGDVVINYGFTPQQLTDICQGGTICFDCFYDLTISIKDECGNVLYALTRSINGSDIGNLSGGAVDDECNSPLGFSLQETYYLQAGNYHFSKTLSVNQDVIDDYWCMELDEGDCMPDYYAIFNDLYNAEPFDNCAAAEEDEFDPNQLSSSNPSCDDYLAIMASDMLPGGQYGAIIPNNDPLSVYNPFSTPNNTHLSGTYRSSSITYLDEFGNPALITVHSDGNGGYSPSVINTTTLLTPTGNPGEYTTIPQNLFNRSDFLFYWKDSWANALVVFHPEYCYYSFCVANAASNTYDENMRSTIEHSVACAGGYYFPLGAVGYTPTVPPLSLTFGPCTTTSSLDPFFQIGGMGYSYAGDMAASLNSYADDGTNSLSILETAIWIALYPDMTFTGFNAQLSKRQINVDDCNLDIVWLKFLELYQAKKMYYYDLAQQDYALVNGCYNGCYGQSGFNSSTLIPEATPPYNQYGNYPSVASPQPCDEATLYQNKVPRFPGTAYLTSMAGNATFQDWFDDLTSNATTEIPSLCDENATNWINQLTGCGFTQTQQDNVEIALQQLCEDIGIPSTSGLSTLDFYTKVDNILIPILGTGYQNKLCTPFLLDPLNFVTVQTMNENVGVLDNCGCDKVLQAKHDFQQGNYPAGVVINNVEEMLQYNEGIYLHDIDQMICACEAAHVNAAGIPDWTPGASWSSGQINTILSENITVPTVLSCPTPCVDCSQMDTELSNLIADIPGLVETDATYPTILTNFMNHAFHFDLTFSSYEDFIASCHSTAINPTCKPTQQAFDFEKWINLVARRGQLLTPSTTPISLLSQNVVFAQSEAGQHAINLGVPATYYSCTGTECDNPSNTLTLTYGEPGKLCTVTFNIPTNADFSFKDIIGFKDIAALTANCSNNTTFSIDAYYLSCGQISMATITGEAECFEIQSCNCGSNTQLCNIPPSTDLSTDELCYNPQLNDIIYHSQQDYTSSVDEQREIFYTAYNGKCAQAFDDEQEDYVAAFNLYQLTLFYYDQAGNLVKTVPPEGQDRSFMDGVTLPIYTDADIATARTNGTPSIIPAHGVVTDFNHYQTNYDYNAYNQLVNTTNPDQAGVSHYWYDFYGRIVASQNPLQATNGLYSYIFYDEKGRPVQTGQVAPSTTISESLIKQDDLGVAFRAWVTSVTRTEVNITAYDTPYDVSIPLKFSNGLQENLHLRVASVFYYNSYNTATNPLSYTTATHYSYDEHGNVKEVLQDAPALAPINLNLKRTNYDYDLISGNVNKVSYQSEQIDEMVHEYHYDWMNRLRDVWTSTDGFHKHRDAHYRYYDYGPLSRKEIGNDKVQGQDFAYTINGWLKGMNSNTLDRDRDMGKDGVDYTLAPNLNIHRLVAKDVVGFTLGYFENDYSAIGTSSFEAGYTGSSFNTAGTNLYNGNIRHVVNAIANLPIQGNAYHYDQLNRIKSMNVYRNTNLVADNNWTTGAYTDDYHADFSYDKNGNLLSLDRNAYGTELMMDKFTYNYATVGGNFSNRLADVQDAGTDYSSYDDIKTGMSSGNYTYNEIGELTQDVAEKMAITWRYGDHKVSTITRLNTDLNSPELHFVYDPFGRRIMKVEKLRSGGVLLPASDWRYTYYTYDAGGQVMATYTGNFKATSGHQVKLAEQNLYGSGRIGMINRNLEIYNNAPVNYTHRQENILHNDNKGNRRFELTNHLGNVLAVINDRKTPVTTLEYTIQLDGINDYLKTAVFSAGLSNELTLEAWVQSTSCSGGEVISAYYYGGTTDKGAILIMSNGKVQIDGRNGTGTYCSSGASTTSVCDGNWHHIVGTSDGTNWKIYVDGTIENSAISSSGNFSGMSQSFYIGTTAYAAGYFNGNIKEVSFWNYDKTFTEINNHTFSQYAGTESGLIGYWKLADNTNPTSDISSGNHPATLYNGAQWSNENLLSYYEPVILSYSDYYAFGMQMPGRTSNTGNYRYGFNGMESDNEVKGQGSSYTTEFRQYDPRIGRWLSLDPLFQNFPWQSPYAAFDNNPIINKDPKGQAAEGGGDPVKTTEAANKAVKSVKSTDKNGAQPARCNVGVNCAFTEITGSNELSHKRANEMYDYMSKSKNFTPIKPSEAQDAANDGEIVIAAWKNPIKDASGHVTLVVPGEATQSGTWNYKPASSIGGIPKVMDTGSGMRTTSQSVNYSFGKSKQAQVIFFKYTPVLTNSNAPNIVAQSLSEKTYGPIMLNPINVKDESITKLPQKSIQPIELPIQNNEIQTIKNS